MEISEELAITLRVVGEEADYYLPFVDVVDEIEFILDMDDEEVGDFNEWGDVERIQMIRDAISEFRKENP